MGIGAIIITRLSYASQMSVAEIRLQSCEVR